MPFIICKNIVFSLLASIFLLFPSNSYSESRPAGGSAITGESAAASGQRPYLPLLDAIQDLQIDHYSDPVTEILTLSAEEVRLRLMPGSRFVVCDQDRIVTLKSPPVFIEGNLMAEKAVIHALVDLLSTSTGSIAAGRHEMERADRIDRFLKTVIIDPGHGGKDSGAVGPLGIKEKDVVYRIAREVKDIIERKMGVRVILTRNGDYFVPLEERAIIAANNDADLFISIHANSTRKKSIKGIEIYFMSVDASDEDAMATANLENSVIQFENITSNRDDNLAAILFDMAQTEHLKDSSEFAKVLHNNLSDVLETEDRGVKQAPFRVLADAAMPAVLVEVGFMSNPYEAMMLAKKETHKRVAEAIFRSVESYRETLEARMNGKEDLRAEKR